MHVPQFGFYEHSFRYSGSYSRPYALLAATAQLIGPDGHVHQIPLFWDGARTWRFRFSPAVLGAWFWSTQSSDPGLDGHSGAFEVVPSQLKGSIRPMAGYACHFERQNGERFWWMGDTAWSLYTDSAETGHNRAAAEYYIDVRAAQGFNVVHSMLLQEEGWINRGGPPFSGSPLEALAGEQINPAYWREVDERLAYLNAAGIVGGLVLGWGRKKWKEELEPWAWDRFAGLEAKKRYARYIAARYSAYDVYFIVAGEWNASARGLDNEATRLEYVRIGNALRAADPHRRMTGIHPGCHGNHFCREFNAVAWNDFGDYQQNYVHLNAEVVASRRYGKPVVNSEYAYYLRDADEDGVVDKPNSQSLEITRHATWDLVMGGAYVVSGFGSTYMGGARCLGPFGVDAPQNDDWEAQVQHVPAFFQGLAWWVLDPRNDLLLSTTKTQSEERTIDGRPAPPLRACWCLAEPGAQYVLYVRGMTGEVTLDLAAGAGDYTVRRYDPRTGAYEDLGTVRRAASFAYCPPDEQDWVVVLRAI